MKITILDFSTGKVHVFPYNEKMYDNVEDFFDSEYCKDKGIKESNCQYMVSSNLTLHIH